MTKSEILKAAVYCSEHKEECIGCPIWDKDENCTTTFAKYILEKENEPAPPEGDTSSKENYLQEYNNTRTKISQVFDFCNRAVSAILEIRANMTETEQTAFDLGEVYRDVLSATVEIEDVKLKGGTGYER